MNNLYELNFDYSSIIPFIIIIAIILLYLFRLFKLKRRTIAVRICCALIAIGCIVFAIVPSVFFINDYKRLKNDVDSGYAMTISGTVQNFHPQDENNNGDTEHFDINGVHFEYSPDTVTSGYNTPQYDGGVITGNGQILQIRYVPYETEKSGDINIIVQIDEINA